MAQGRSTKIISMIKWIRTSRLSVKNSLSCAAAAPPSPTAPGLAFKVWRLAFGVWRLGNGDWGLGSRVEGGGLRVEGLVFGVEGGGLRVEGLGFGV